MGFLWEMVVSRATRTQMMLSISAETAQPAPASVLYTVAAYRVSVEHDAWQSRQAAPKSLWSAGESPEHRLPGDSPKADAVFCSWRDAAFVLARRAATPG